MPKLSLELPTIQNWNCHNCSGCCKQHGIFITEEEKQRIESQGWDKTQELPNSIAPIVTEKSLLGKAQHRLAQQPDGACVFLDEQGLCRIHGKFGEAAKPLACRIYPYAFHPKGDQVVVSLRFSCPSITQNLGKSLTRQKREIREIAELVVPEDKRRQPPPKLYKRTQLDWQEILSIVEAMDGTLAEQSGTIFLKLHRLLFLAEMLKQTNYQNIRHERLRDLLTILIEAAPAEVPEVPEPHKPSQVAMMQFRLLCGQYARKDTFASMDTSIAGRWKQFNTAIRLSSASGILPEMSTELGAVPYASLDGAFGPLTSESEELLTRYFRIKLQGMHFCGAAYYDYSLIDGLHALLLVLPVTLYLARWRAVTLKRDTITAEDVRTSLEVVDHQHGYSPFFGTWGARKRVSTLADSGELRNLLTWYAA